MEVAVDLVVYICRWCGAPYAIPRFLAENTNVTKRCALGHEHATGRTPQELLHNTREERDELRTRLDQQSRYLSQLKGQITRLKKAVRKAAA